MAACKSKKTDNSAQLEAERRYFTTPAKTPESLASNHLANEPTAFLRSQADSPIHWQCYTPKVLEQAEASQRLIFVLVGSTAFPESLEVAKALAEEQAETINRLYVPVLADIEVAPALAEACNTLASGQRIAVDFPFALWLTHEGNPVHFFPFKNIADEDPATKFSQSQRIVSAILEKSVRYVIEDSRYRTEERLEQVRAHLQTQEAGEASEGATPSQRDFFRAAQSLASLYDDINRDFDDVGGIPPGGLVSTLSQVASHPAAPARLRRSALEASRDALDQIVKTAVRDPLDDYFFVSRRSISYAIPVFAKHIVTQTEMLGALASVAPTPAITLAEDRLLAALENDPFTVRSVISSQSAIELFAWEEAELVELLSKDEFKVAKAAFDISSLGNIPTHEDISRQYLRRNTLGLKVSGEKLAATTKMGRTESDQLLKSAVAKLRAHRAKSLETSGELQSESLLTLSHQALLLSAMSRSQATRPSAAKLAQASALVDMLTQAYRTPEGILLLTDDSSYRQPTAPAHTYATLISALLDYHRVTWDPQVLAEAKDLTLAMLARFTSEDHLLFEHPESERVLDFPNHNTTMIFGNSTWGLASGILNRFASLGLESEKLDAARAVMIPLLHEQAIKLPLIHTDSLLNAINTNDGWVLLLSKDMSANEKKSLRSSLTDARYGSIFAVVESETTAALPSLGGKTAALIRDGKVQQSWQNTRAIPSDLADILAKN